jgi:RNA polymerase sigma factor (sigma-70 family)
VLDCGSRGGAIATDLLDLVKRCRDGDPEAWRALLPSFEEIGRRALRSFRLSAADRDDTLSDALASLYAGGLSRFRGGTVPELVAFLRTVVRNRAVDLVKDRNRWTSPDACAGDRQGRWGAGTRDAHSADVSGGLADEECLEFLRQEIGQLTRQERELYLMKARGLKEREIAAQTGRPPGTVASQIARLLERLRSRLRARGCV